jgi:kinesin family protein 20
MSADEAYQALMIGRENLQFAATKLNTNSSRSHCIFTLKIIKVADPAQPHLARSVGEVAKYFFPLLIVLF